MSSLTSYNGLSVLTPEPTADGGKAINDNFKALSTAQETTDPGSSNDNSEGYSAGSRWINTTTGIEWLCTSSALGAAVWVKLVPTLDQVTAVGSTTANPTTFTGGLISLGSGGLSTILGQDTAAGVNATAIGYNASAGDYSIAVGWNAAAPNNYGARNIAIGGTATVGGGYYGVTIGGTVSGSGFSGGFGSSVVQGVAIGTNATSSDSSIALGYHAAASSNQFVATFIGTDPASLNIQSFFGVWNESGNVHNSVSLIGEWTNSTESTRTARASLCAHDFTDTPREGIRVESDGTQPLLGFYGTTATAIPTVTGSKASGAAWVSLLAALVSLGLVIDDTTA